MHYARDQASARAPSAGVVAPGRDPFLCSKRNFARWAASIREVRIPWNPTSQARPKHGLGHGLKGLGANARCWAQLNGGHHVRMAPLARLWRARPIWIMRGFSTAKQYCAHSDIRPLRASNSFDRRYAASVPLAIRWASAASAVCLSALATSAAQSRKDERKPCGTNWPHPARLISMTRTWFENGLPFSL